ncbi:MAG: hypothetical protein ACK5P5_06055 [Pseudobdellovibrionaceae bacterium]
MKVKSVFIFICLFVVTPLAWGKTKRPALAVAPLVIQPFAVREAQAKLNKFCFKANQMIESQAITSQLEVMPFNRIYGQLVPKKHSLQLILRAQTKEGSDFWTHSQTLLASSLFKGKIQNQRALHIFSSSNTSQVKWNKQFSLIQHNKKFVLYYLNQATRYSFQVASLAECEEIIF